MRRSAKIMGVALMLACILCALIWYAALKEDSGGKLEVTVLPGGSAFVRTPSGRTILINGGADDSILRQLGSVMPFYDHSIDVVVTQAQTSADVGGLTSVLSRYDTSVLVRSATYSSAPEVAAFTGAVSAAQQKGTRLVVLRRGQVLDLGDETYLETIFPDRDASQMSPSDGCLMFKLLFENTSFLFSCGSTAIEQYVVMLDGSKLESSVLIATGNESIDFLGFVAPQLAVLPCGTSATGSFEKLSIQTTSACESPVVFTSDGQTVARE